MTDLDDSNRRDLVSLNSTASCTTTSAMCKHQTGGNSASRTRRQQTMSKQPETKTTDLRSSNTTVDPYFRQVPGWSPPKNATVHLPDGEEQRRHHRCPPPSSVAIATPHTTPIDADGICSQSAPHTLTCFAALDELYQGVRAPPNVVAPSSSPPDVAVPRSASIGKRSCDTMTTVVSAVGTATSPSGSRRRRQAALETTDRQTNLADTTTATTTTMNQSRVIAKVRPIS